MRGIVSEESEKFTFDQAKIAATIAVNPQKSIEERLSAIAMMNVASPDGIYVEAIRVDGDLYVMPKAMYNILRIIKAKFGTEEARYTMAEWFDIDIEKTSVLENEQAFPAWRKKRS